MYRWRSVFLTSLVLASVIFLSLRLVPPGETEPLHPHVSVLPDLGQSTTPETNFTPPFQTAGRHIVDADGRRFKLASINWYGASDVLFVPGGLDVRHRRDIATTIREMGFNSVRFPYSDQMVIENPIIPLEAISANLDLLDGFDLEQGDGGRGNNDLKGPRALDVFKACVDAMTDAGLAVIPNNHVTNAAWCDGFNLCDSSWRNDQLMVCKIKQTTEDWIDHWKTIMRPHIDNPLVIGADLRNEPRGLWGTMTWRMLAASHEKASEALLQLNPNWLMFIEGVSSANDCSGARHRPIKLSIPDRVVYQSHVYAWSGWGQFSPYHKRLYPSFALDMDRKWGYLLANNTAPVWVGEFGAPSAANEGDHNYWNNLMRYLRDTDADWGYWALNPRKPANNEEESYGLLEDDWKTVAEDWRMSDLRKLM